MALLVLVRTVDRLMESGPNSLLLQVGSCLLFFSCHETNSQTIGNRQTYCSHLGDCLHGKHTLNLEIPP